MTPFSGARLDAADNRLIAESHKQKASLRRELYAIFAASFPEQGLTRWFNSTNWRLSLPGIKPYAAGTVIES